VAISTTGGCCDGIACFKIGRSPGRLTSDCSEFGAAAIAQVMIVNLVSQVRCCVTAFSHFTIS